MEFEWYQSCARKTAVYPGLNQNFVYPTLGLCGETGEVSEKIKKILRDNNGEISEAKLGELKKELGDVLWYLANLATELGLSLDAIAEDNLKKLMDRQNRNVIHGNGDNR
jgi:NTP pyrophosphatase (non-canonical NTP hydrolase)